MGWCRSVGVGDKEHKKSFRYLPVYRRLSAVSSEAPADSITYPTYFNCRFKIYRYIVFSALQN